MGALKDATKPHRWHGVWDPDQGSRWGQEPQVCALCTRTQPAGSAQLLLLGNQGFVVSGIGFRARCESLIVPESAEGIHETWFTLGRH